MDEQLVMQRAVEAKRAGRYEEARLLYHSVIEAIPQCDPAYKGLAKVEIAAGRYENAIRATLMKIDLGIFFTRQLSPQELAFIRHQAIQNLSAPKFRPEIRFGKTIIPSGETCRSCRIKENACDVALLAWAEPDLYFYLGHCLVRMFPAAFSHYRISEEALKNFEKALSGFPSGRDARDMEIAPVFYISGFWLAVANIESALTSIEPDTLKLRFRRELDLFGLVG